MRLRTRPETRIAALAVIAACCAFVIHRAGGGAPAPVASPSSARGVVGDVRPGVSLGDLSIVVLRTPSVAQRLSGGNLPSEEQERSWTAEDDAAQQQVLSDLQRHGFAAHPLYSYTRVLDGFSARLAPAAAALLERDPEIAAVDPVTVDYPATVSTSPLGAASPALGPGVALPGFDGAGVTIALLDTGVDAAAPYLAGRIEPGIDVVGGDSGAGALHDPASPHAPEAHGTELAGLLVGSGGPGGMQGVAPGASVLPIRVAGWQSNGEGGEALYGRSDQLIAGLERAVDPSGAGEVAGAVRVALIGLAEPFGGFPDSPEAQAVAGARALGVLVVAPAGNDGVAGPWFGSVAGPGGAPAALTVGAVDSRPDTASERLVVHEGLNVVFDGQVALLAGSSASALDLPLVPARAGVSAHGAATLVEAGANPVAAVARASAAGARAVLLAGVAPAAGTLGSLGVPVVWVPATLAAELARLLTERSPLEVALGGLRGTPNAQYGSLALFSSRGLSYAGLVDPQLSAPGVDIATAEPGANVYAAVSGTSAAAAAVAGAAALLAQARPALDASELASLLAGSTRADGFPLAAGGTGVLDLGASAAGEVAASSTSVGFGRWSGAGWHARRTLTLANISTRPLRLSLGTGSALVRAVPGSLALAPGAQASVSLIARSNVEPAATLLAGVVSVAVPGAAALRIPWTIAFHTPARPLLAAARITPRSFVPAPNGGARLRVVLGALPGGARLEVEPAARLEIRLYASGGDSLGVLARLNDLLPGRYTFAIAGTSPDGARLAPGVYTLALVAWPLLGGPPSRARVGFRIQ